MKSLLQHNALLEILLHIGTSFEMKTAVNEALLHYLQQLDLSGIVLFEKKERGCQLHTAKPKVYKNDAEVLSIYNEVVSNSEEIEERYFKKFLPYAVLREERCYYLYELKGFGLLLLVRNTEAFSQEMSKSLRPINEKFANSLIACRNIEKLRAQDKQLLQQSRLAQMGEMLSMIAHQWRQPLGTISSTIINMQVKLSMGKFSFETKEGIAECQDFLSNKLENIEGYVQDLSTTIDDFRNFHNPNKEKKSLQVNVPLQKALSLIKTSMQSDGIEFIESYESRQEISMADGEIMQVFLNILKNAKDNFKEKEIQNAKIFITSEDVGDRVKIEFLDNGGGIAEDILFKIFDPYFSTKDEKNGTGLGLYMSKTIIQEHHNGTLEAKNKDAGVSFTITLKR